LGRGLGTAALSGTARHGSAAVPNRAVPGRARASAVPCGPAGHLYKKAMATIPPMDGDGSPNAYAWFFSSVI